MRFACSYWESSGLSLEMIIIMIMFACFHFTGKYFRLRQELNILLTWSIVLLDTCFNAVFVNPSDPGALLCDKDLIKLVISAGETHVGDYHLVGPGLSVCRIQSIVYNSKSIRLSIRYTNI